MTTLPLPYTPAPRHIWAGVVGTTCTVAVIAGGPLGIAALCALPVLLTILWVVARTPSHGLWLTVAAGFAVTGLSRYVDAPTGLLVDAVLAWTALATWLGYAQRRGGAPISRDVRGLLWVTGLWFAYNLLELVNPVRPSALAWFYAVRGVALYPMLAVPLAVLLLRERAHLRRFLALWLVCSVLGTLWGLKQRYLGLDSHETAWLMVPGNRSTHLLFGQLRVFSFYSDAGQFGAAQGHAAVLAGVLATGARRRRTRWALWLVAALSIHGLLISGTRGAIAVPFIGGLVYLLMSGSWRAVLIGGALIGSAYGLLRFTYVGQGNYEVRRFRTAIVEGSQNASLQVRLENQRRLRAYLATRPFGGGVGSAGYWGQRFSRGTFLAELALDSWYVKIAAEQGPVGLVLYLLMLAYLLVVGALRVRAIRDPSLRTPMLALYAGLWGIVVASYGNQVLGQVPTGLLVYVGLAFLFGARAMDVAGAPTTTFADSSPRSARSSK